MNSADDLREEMAQQQAAVRRTCGCWLWLLVVAMQVDQPPQQATTSHHSLCMESQTVAPHLQTSHGGMQT